MEIFSKNNLWKYSIRILYEKLDPDLSHGDIAAIYTVGGASQGFSYLIGKS